MKIRQIVAIILAIVVMSWIFYNSAQVKAESSEASGRIVTFLAQHGIYLSDHIVRKSAHFCEYALLGFLLAFAFEGKAWIALIIGVGYACSDEFHQLYVAGRAGQFKDIVIDSVGVVAGMAAALLIIFLIKLIFGNNHSKCEK